MSEPESVINVTFDYLGCHPMLNVSLTSLHGNRTVSCLALVDSGASWCAFPESLREPLGIGRDALLPSIEVSPVSGPPIPIHLDVVTLDLGFSKYETHVGFHEGLYAVLGHIGFFDHWVVIFDTANKRFGITNRAIPTP